jgi:hypothetical protein
VIVVVVAAGFTWWGVVPLLPEKFVVPEVKVAVSVFAPAVVEVRLQEPMPAARVIGQVALPSETDTVPVGVPPEEVTVTPTE